MELFGLIGERVNEEEAGIGQRENAKKEQGAVGDAEDARSLFGDFSRG